MTDVAIVGAGIVGVCTALQLQADGHAVTLVDPEEPGAGTAAGSAGYLSDTAVFPLAHPALLVEMPRMLLDPLGPLVIPWWYAPRLTGWGLRFLGAMSPRQVERGTRALVSLNRDALAALFGLAERSGAGEFLTRDGAIVACRSERTLGELRAHLPVLKEMGIPSQILGAEELRALEPTLTDDLMGAIFFPREGRCADPEAFGRRLAQRFAHDGGTIERARAVGLGSESDGSWRVFLESGQSIDAKRVVVAAGVWSGKLLRPLGYRVPIETQRGYNLMLPDPGVMPKRVVQFGEPHFCATPMNGGLRLAGTVELAGLNAPPNYRRSDMLYELASRYIPGLRREGATKWMGFRPSFPDSLPAIGAASRHANLFYCFGHEKLGLTQAGVTANCVADLVAGRPARVDLEPFRLERFA